MLAALVRFLIRLFPILSYDYRHRIKPKQMCPACGAYRRHQMKFEAAGDTQTASVVLTCAQCSARWSYEPRVRAQDWVKPPEE
jgi:formate dehydrogenase maturation protein FdhE